MRTVSVACVPPPASSVEDVAGVRLAVCAAGEIWGGVERFVVTAATGLVHEGIVPLVMVFHDGALAARLRERGIAVEVLNRYPKYDLRAVGELRGLLRAHGINVLHVHGYRASVVGGLAAQGLPVRIVKTEHGQLEPFPGWMAAWSHARLIANTLLERLVSRTLVDTQVFVSRDIQRRLGSRPGRIPQRLIYNGIEPPAPHRDAAARRDAGVFALGIVGRIDRVKGHDVLLHALARLRHLPALRLHVFGTGPLEARCRRLARDLSLAEVVHFHGFEPAIHSRMAALDALLEAMYLKVPIVASRVGGLREVLEEDACGRLVEPDDPAALAAAIEELYADRGLGRRLAAGAHALVRRRFLAPLMVGHYADVYRQLLGRAG